MKRLIRNIATIVTICTLFVNMAFANSELLYETDSGVGGFVARLYNVALDRDYDINGYNDWCTKLVTGEMNGADVAFGFLFSDEFINKNYSNEEYVNILYSVFFDRGADQQGFNDWVGQLNNGVTRQSVLSGFINSTEWANVCISFGIISGGNANATVIPEASEGTIGFVTRLYELCLGRSPDLAGLEHWTSVLTSQEQTAKEVAYGFIFSDEFANRYASLSPNERIVLFYNVFLNRQPDASSLSWEGAASLDGYEGRRQLFIGFADSTEFRNICAEYGVICGASIALPHTHNWTEQTWTEDVAVEVRVDVITCGCGVELVPGDFEILMAHQAYTGSDGMPYHYGWHNEYEWIEIDTQITHSYIGCECGAIEPTFQETHVHEYSGVVIATIQETRVVSVYHPYICRCNLGWLTHEELEAHQDSTGLDGTCNSCGSYFYNGRTTFMNYYVNPNDPYKYTCPNCGNHNFTRNSVHCGGWANGGWRTPITGTSVYSILQCSCGEILTENDMPNDRSFPTDGSYTYIRFYPDESSRARYDILDNVFYGINY